MLRRLSRAFDARFTIVFACALALANPASAVDPSAACEAGRLKAAAAYSSCLLKAEAAELMTGNPADTAKCVERFDKACDKVVAKYGLDCPASSDCASIRSVSECAADALPPATTTTLPPTTTTLLPTTTTLPACGANALVDFDADGFTPSTGDCDDCDPLVNPGALEISGNSLDDDCDGTVDNVVADCDSSLALASTDAGDAAKALDLCRVTTESGTGWGVISAKWVRANGSVFLPDAQVGLMDAFGSNQLPFRGQGMVVLSTGRARTSAQPSACGSASCFSNLAGVAPAGFPQGSASCPVASTIADDVALELRLRAPSNAVGYRFRLDYYTFEYPEWVCTNFTDQFMTLASPAPGGAINGNISFDINGVPISVNSNMDVCSGCTLGAGALVGTGFDAWNDAGATGWLTTAAPVTAGSVFTLRFAIWDGGDQTYDSTVLLDGFEWITSGPVSVSTNPAH